MHVGYVTQLTQTFIKWIGYVTDPKLNTVSWSVLL